MSEDPGSAAPLDIGAYCRDVEAHLTRVNGGHLVRIVGPGFELVRDWALSGVPLSVVFRAIDLKAARHQTGTSRRPLRIEFCDEDVRELFAGWRRAVGVPASPASEATDPVAEPDEPAGAARRTATKELDRAIDRLSRAAGRLDWPDALREAVGLRLTALTALRAELRLARGEARSLLLARVSDGDAAFAAAIREAAPAAVLGESRAEAERDLASYRGRLAPAAWASAVDRTTDRLLRERLGLPH
jgi:hypothetical protein